MKDDHLFDTRRFDLVSTIAEQVVAHAFGLIVVTLAGDRVSAITAFESGAMARFGLPRSVARD